MTYAGPPMTYVTLSMTYVTLSMTYADFLMTYDMRRQAYITGPSIYVIQRKTPHLQVASTQRSVI